MATKNIAFNSRITQIETLCNRVLNNVAPMPSDIEISNGLKYFTLTLNSILKDLSALSFSMFEPDNYGSRTVLFPNLNYTGFYEALDDVLCIYPLIGDNHYTLGKTIINSYESLLVFLDYDYLQELPYKISLLYTLFSPSLFKDLLNFLTLKIFPLVLYNYDIEKSLTSFAIPACLSSVFSYVTDKAMLSQLLETLMAYKYDVNKDLFSVIAYGYETSHYTATRLLFNYWPSLNPMPSERKTKFTPWDRIKCQTNKCVGGKDNYGTKICIDPSFSMQYSESPPPCILCQKCYNKYIRNDPKEFKDHSDSCIDLIAPLEYVALKCDNKNCPNPMQNADFTCFAHECTQNNLDRPVRYCTICFEAKHPSSKMLKSGPHIYQGKAQHLWSPPSRTNLNSVLFPGFDFVIVEAIVRLLMGVESPPSRGVKGVSIIAGSTAQHRMHGGMKRYQSMRDDIDDEPLQQTNPSANTPSVPTAANSINLATAGGLVGDEGQIIAKKRIFTFEDRLWLSRYGIYLLLSLCDNYLQAPHEQLGRLLASLFHWFDCTAYLPQGGLASSIEALKPDKLCDWIKAKTHVYKLIHDTMLLDGTSFGLETYFNLSNNRDPSICVPNEGSDRAIVDPYQALFLSCLAPTPPQFARLSTNPINTTKAVELKRGLFRLFCLIPYDLVTYGAWQVLLPLWMEAARTVTEPSRVGADFGSLLKKTFDTEMSPLQFTRPQDAFTFITDRLEGFDSSTGRIYQAYDALVWLEILTTSGVLVPLELLLKAFLYHVTRAEDYSKRSGYFKDPQTIPSRYKVPLDGVERGEAGYKSLGPTGTRLTMEQEDLNEWLRWRGHQLSDSGGGQNTTFAQLYTMENLDDIPLLCIAIMLRILKHQMKIHNVPFFLKPLDDECEDHEVGSAGDDFVASRKDIVTFMLQIFNHLNHSLTLRCNANHVYTYYTQAHFRNYWRLFIYCTKVSRDLVKMICPEFMFTKSRSESSDMDPSSVASSDSDETKSEDSGIFAKDSDASASKDKRFKLIKTTTSGLFSKDARFLGKAIRSPQPISAPEAGQTSPLLHRKANQQQHIAPPIIPQGITMVSLGAPSSGKAVGSRDLQPRQRPQPIVIQAESEERVGVVQVPAPSHVTEEEGEEEGVVESLVTFLPTQNEDKDGNHVISTLEPMEDFCSDFQVEQLETAYTFNAAEGVIIVTPTEEGGGGDETRPSVSSPSWSQGVFWKTSQGEFRIEYDTLPIRFRLVHSLFKILAELDKLLPDISECPTKPSKILNSNGDPELNGGEKIDELWHLPLENYQELQMFRTSATYNCLTSLNDLVIAGNFLMDKRGEHRGFIIWAQENMIGKTLWSLMAKQESYVNQLTLPLFLKCLTLPNGRSSFWKGLMMNYFNNDWRFRISAINSMLSLFQFFDCAEELGTTEECSNCIAFAFYLLAQTLRDENLHISQYTKIMFHSLPFSSFKIIFKALSWQFMTLPMDRLSLLTMVRSLLLVFKPRIGQKSTRDFFVYILYHQATDFMVKSTETLLIEQYLDTYDKTKITPLFGYRPKRKDRRSQISRFNEVLVNASHSTPVHSISLTMNLVTDQLIEGDTKSPPLAQILGDKYASIDSYVIGSKERDGERGKSSFTDRDQDRTSVDVLEKLNDEPSNLIHTLYANVNKEASGCGMWMNSILETMMNILMGFHAADAGRIEKRVAECLNETIAYIQQLLYYHSKEKVFTLPPHALRSYPLTNSFLAFLFRVLDLNVIAGYKMLPFALDLLVYLPSTQVYATDATPDYYTLYLLSRGQRKLWLNSFNVILYKYEIDENANVSYPATACKAIEIVLASLSAQYSHWCGPGVLCKSTAPQGPPSKSGVPSSAGLVKITPSCSRRSSPSVGGGDVAGKRKSGEGDEGGKNRSPSPRQTHLNKFSSFLKPNFGKGDDDKLHLNTNLSPAFSFESLTSILKKSPQHKYLGSSASRRTSSLANEDLEDETTEGDVITAEDPEEQKDRSSAEAHLLNVGGLGDYENFRKCPKCERIIREIYDDEVLGLATVCLELFVRRCPIAATPHLLDIMVIISKITDNVFYPWEEDPSYELYGEGHALPHIRTIGTRGHVGFTSIGAGEPLNASTAAGAGYASFSSSTGAPLLPSTADYQPGLGSNMLGNAGGGSSLAETFFIPGHCRSIALQMMRCLLHQFAPNGLFLRYFSVCVSKKRPLFLVNRVMAESLRGFTEFTPLHPLSSMLQDLEKEKGVLQLTKDKLGALLINVRDYLECVGRQEKFSVYWKSHLFPLFETFFANLASGIAVAHHGSNSGSTQFHHFLLLTMDYLILFDIMITLLKIPTISFFKNLFESMGKILAFALSKYPLDITKVWEICYLCNTNLGFGKERDKQFLARVVVSELGHVISFKRMILPSNVLLLIQLVLFDVGGSLGTSIMNMFTYQATSQDGCESEIDPQNLINSSAGDVMRSMMNECITFLMDIDAIGRLSSGFKSYPGIGLSPSFIDHKPSSTATTSPTLDTLGGGEEFKPFYFNVASPRSIVNYIKEDDDHSGILIRLGDVRITSECPEEQRGLAATSAPINTFDKKEWKKPMELQQVVNASFAPPIDMSSIVGKQRQLGGEANSAPASTQARRPSLSAVPQLTEDTLGAFVKVGVAQFISLEMSRDSDHSTGTGGGGLRNHFSFLYNNKGGSPNPSIQLSPPAPGKRPIPLITSQASSQPMTSEQQGLKDFNECVNRIRMLCWLMLSSLQHNCLTKASASLPCQPIKIDNHPRISDLILHLVSRYPEFSAASVLHTTTLFYGFMLCQLWTVYTEYVISTYASDNEACLAAENGLMAFWCQIIPGILQLMTISKSFPEMICIHFLNLIESLQEINSSSLVKLYPLWRPILYYQEVLPSHLQIRLNKILNWLPALDLEEGNPFHNISFLEWLRKLQFKLGHTEMQSSLAIQIYTL